MLCPHAPAVVRPKRAAASLHSFSAPLYSFRSLTSHPCSPLLTLALHSLRFTPAPSPRISKNQALWKEHAKFMARLKEKRRVQEALEFRGAQLMQTLYRSYRWRQILRASISKLIDPDRLERSFNAIQSMLDARDEERALRKEVTRRREEAALQIQCTWRSSLVQRAMRKERAIRQVEDENSAAGLLQRLARGRKARAAVSEKRRVLQDRAEGQASLSIQTAFRGRKGRIAAHSKRLRLHVCAAMWIQAWFRRILGHRALCRGLVFSTHSRSYNGAASLQRVLRGREGRRRAYKQGNFVETELQEAATLAMQRVGRGMLGRRLFAVERLRQTQERMLRALITMQRVGRGYLGRVRFAAFLNLKLEDIFLQAKRGNAQQVADLYSGAVTDVRYTESSADDAGNTVLSVASAHGRLDIVVMALGWNSDINHRNAKGLSPVELAVLASQVRIRGGQSAPIGSVVFVCSYILHVRSSCRTSSPVSPIHPT